MKYHPDKITDQDKEDGNDMIKKINEAYETLKDEKKRNIYDKFGKNAPSFLFEESNARGGFPHPFSGFPGFNMNGNDSDSDEVESGYPNFPPGFPGGDFKAMFGDILKNQQQARNKVTIRPINVYLNLTLEEIYSGKDWSDDVVRFSLCKECDGLGNKDKELHQCKRCVGTGMTYTLKQTGPGNIQQTQRPCEDCRGTGRDSSAESCTECSGEGIRVEKITVSHKIHPGARVGDIIIIREMGHQTGKLNGRPSNERGPIHLVINEEPHPIYKRGICINDTFQPENLAIEIQIELYEALCGFTREITYLDGTKFYINSDSIVKDNDIKVIKSKGMPNKMHFKGNGDLYVIFKVEYPKQITAATKSKIYELLTKEKYSHAKIHKVPKNSQVMTLDVIPNIKNYNFDKHDKHDNNDNDNDSDEPNEGCKTQ